LKSKEASGKVKDFYERIIKMIDFACKKFDLKEVIRCSLNFTKTEFKILEYLMENSNKKFTTQEISKYLNRIINFSKSYK